MKKLGYTDKPNYNQLRDIFTKGLTKLGIKDTWKLALPIGGAPKPSTSSPKVSENLMREVREDTQSIRDRSVKANSIDPDQTAPRLIRVYTVCHSAKSFQMFYLCIRLIF